MKKIVKMKICEKNIEPDKLIDHFHLTGKYRRPAHNKCNINVTQKQGIFYLLYFRIVLIMTVIYFLKS